MTAPFPRLAITLAVMIGLQHVAIFIIESFLWRKPAGLKFFRLTQEKADATAQLAVNQGVYNAFLAAGLFWGVAVRSAGGLGYDEFSRSILIFFFGCVAVAGMVGGATVHRRIFFGQGVPALIGVLLAVVGI